MKSAFTISVLSVLLLSSPGEGAILALYNFTGNSLASADDDTANLTSTADNIRNGLGVTSIPSSTGNPANGRSFLTSETNGVDEAGAVGANDYLEFTLTPANGYQVNLATISLDFGANFNNQVRGFAIRSSLDEYTDTILNVTRAAGNGELTNAVFPYSTSLSSATYQGITGPVTFRIYGFDNANSSTIYLRFDNIRLDGTVTLVPEPSGVMLLGGGAVFAMLRRSRGKR